MHSAPALDLNDHRQVVDPDQPVCPRMDDALPIDLGIAFQVRPAPPPNEAPFGDA